MNRRGFLRTLIVGGGALALTRAIEPVAEPIRTYFLPPAGGWHGNTFLTPDIVTREALRALENRLTFANVVNRAYDDAYARNRAFREGVQYWYRAPNGEVTVYPTSDHAVDAARYLQQELRARPQIIPVRTPRERGIDFKRLHEQYVEGLLAREPGLPWLVDLKGERS